MKLISLSVIFPCLSNDGGTGGQIKSRSPAGASNNLAV